jgi:hypothetical protein
MLTSIHLLFTTYDTCIYIKITLFNKVCQWLAAGQWFSTGTPVSSTNKTDCHDITEIMLKVALKKNTRTLSLILLLNPRIEWSLKDSEVPL